MTGLHDERRDSNLQSITVAGAYNEEKGERPMHFSRPPPLHKHAKTLKMRTNVRAGGGGGGWDARQNDNLRDALRHHAGELLYTFYPLLVGRTN